MRETVRTPIRSGRRPRTGTLSCVVIAALAGLVCSGLPAGAAAAPGLVRAGVQEPLVRAGLSVAPLVPAQDPVIPQPVIPEPAIPQQAPVAQQPVVQQPVVQQPVVQPDPATLVQPPDPATVVQQPDVPAITPQTPEVPATGATPLYPPELATPGLHPELTAPEFQPTPMGTPSQPGPPMEDPAPAPFIQPFDPTHQSLATSGCPYAAAPGALLPPSVWSVCPGLEPGLTYSPFLPYSSLNEPWAPSSSSALQIQIPWVSGFPTGDAEATLANSGLNTGSVTQQQSSSPPGTVLRTDPPFGSAVEFGHAVDLVVAGP